MPALLAVLALCAAVHAQPQHQRIFGARLSTVPVALGSRAMAGSGTVTATLSGTRLIVDGAFKGLDAPATVARVHKSPKPGIRGPAAFELSVTTAASGTITGELTLTAAQVQELVQNRYYVQLHSEKAPDGHLWGWLFAQETQK
jgi:hypothetical protein